MKKKLCLSAAFLVSLLPMLLNQYGGQRGVQEIAGIINLTNPIGAAAVILFGLGVWLPVRKQVLGKALCIVGISGVVLSEIYTFFTWHVQTITGEVSLQRSLQLTFPEFYFGLAVSLAMIVGYFTLNRQINEHHTV